MFGFNISCISHLGKFWIDLNLIDTKNMKKRCEKILNKINYQKPLIHEILYSSPNLIASLHIQECKPNQRRLEAALRTSLQTCKNSQKVEFWNQGYRAIQGTKPIARASLDNSEGVPITNNNKSAKNRYHSLKQFQENSWSCFDL